MSCNRICVKCGNVMEPVKNGFTFSIGTRFYTSDLWGCKKCRRFQIHGTNKHFGYVAKLIEPIDLISDPGNKSFLAILEPKFVALPEYFYKHMKEWYPGWNWKEGELPNV